MTSPENSQNIDTQEQLDQNQDQPQDPSRRKFIKQSAQISATTVLALAGITPSKTEAQEIDNSGQPDKLTTTQIKEIVNNSELTIEEIRELEAIIDPLMDHDRFTDKSDLTDFPLKYGGFSKSINGEMFSPYGIKNGFSKDQMNEIDSLISSGSYSHPFYDSLKTYFPDKTKLREVQELYINFLNQIDKTLSMVNKGLFFNHEEQPDGSRQVATSYNRIIAVGMVEGWDSEQFKVALAEIFPRKISNQGIGYESSERYFPSKLMKWKSKTESYPVFYDPDGQQGNIDGFMNDINNEDLHEVSYKGKKSPLQRARELYGGDRLRQGIYALNILTADQLRSVQTELQNQTIKTLKSETSQQLSNIFAGTFSPRNAK